MRVPWTVVASCMALLATYGCTDGVDAHDAATSDAAPGDTAVADSPVPDSVPPPDAALAILDATLADATPTDATPTDATPHDAAPADAMPPDATPPPGSVALSWNITRGWHNPTCMELSVTTVVVDVAPGGASFTFACADGGGTLTGLDAGVYALTLRLLASDGVEIAQTSLAEVVVTPGVVTAPPPAEFYISQWLRRIRLSWSFLHNDSPASCDEVGVATIGLLVRNWGVVPPVTTVIAAFDCADAEALFPPIDISTAEVVVVTFDGAGERLPITQPLQVYGSTLVVLLPVIVEAIDEPIAQLRQMFNGARAAYEASGAFPSGHPPTPSLGSCCASAGSICAPGYLDWSELNFAVLQRHRFMYEFVPSPTGFIARARGDSDCNGVYATYWLVGTIDAAGAVVGDDVLYVDLPLE